MSILDNLEAYIDITWDNFTLGLSNELEQEESAE
jgi:hypothetical protein